MSILYLCAQKTADFNEFTEGGFPVKVRSSVKPICEKCKIIKRKGPVGVGEAVATVDGKVVVTAELTFMVGE